MNDDTDRRAAARAERQDFEVQMAESDRRIAQIRAKLAELDAPVPEPPPARAPAPPLVRLRCAPGDEWESEASRQIPPPPPPDRLLTIRTRDGHTIRRTLEEQTVIDRLIGPSHLSRPRISQLLSFGEQTAEELAAALGCTVATAKRRLRPLLDTGAVVRVREYNRSTRQPAVYALEDTAARAARRLLDTKSPLTLSFHQAVWADWRA